MPLKYSGSEKHPSLIPGRLMMDASFCSQKKLRIISTEPCIKNHYPGKAVASSS